MAIIPGIQICIPASGRRADAIIVGMERLLALRKYGRISRRAFLVAWNKKRIALRLTSDYKELQARVRDEAHGHCERCNERPGDHLHHITPVAFEPRMALDRKNCRWVCVVCHEDEDREARERVLKERDRTKERQAQFAGAQRIFISGGPGSKLGTQESAESEGAKRPIQLPEVTN